MNTQIVKSYIEAYKKRFPQVNEMEIYKWDAVKKFQEHTDEFEQEEDFKRVRNSIGALILLPNGTNQSFNSDKYPNKLPHYIKENTYAQTLHPDFYLRNPNFLNSPNLQSISFRAYPTLNKDDILERANTVQEICEVIWSKDYYKTP